MAEGRIIRILLAEDNPADVYLLRQAFELTNQVRVDLTVVADGEAALDVVRAENAAASKFFDLIVLDLNLPKADGADVLRTIRSTDAYARVPVAILTSSDSARDREDAYRHGADSYLTKPANLDAFLSLGGILISLARPRGQSVTA